MTNFKNRITHKFSPFKTPEDKIYYKKLYLQLGKIFCEYLKVDYNTYINICFDKNRRKPYMDIKHLSRYTFILAGWGVVSVTMFEDLDHSTVINSISFIENLRDSDFKFRELCDKMIQDKRIKYIYKRIKCKARHIPKYGRRQ